MNIAYQGTPGSYSEQLLKTIFPDSFYQPCETFSSLIDFASKSGNFGLLPVENSIAGTVNEAYEELIESDLSIFGEYIKKIKHSLIALPESSLELISTFLPSMPYNEKETVSFKADPELFSNDKRACVEEVASIPVLSEILLIFLAIFSAISPLLIFNWSFPKSP